MSEILTMAEMRALEAAAIASGKVTGRDLMELAGKAVVKAVFEEWPELGAGAHHAVVLCGPGNNGGDGFVVARLLGEIGWDVEVFLYGDPERLPEDAGANYERWLKLGAVTELTADFAAKGTRPALLIDAMFGIGLDRAIPLELAEAFRQVQKRKPEGRQRTCRSVAIDCPSGVNCDTGQFWFPEPPAKTDAGDHEELWGKWWTTQATPRILQVDLIVTFHRKKVGHCLDEIGRKLCVADIGLGPDSGIHALAVLHSERSHDLVELDPVGRELRMLVRSDLKKRTSAHHKYLHGHALVLSGASGKGGAARLAARGALRIGAGAVTVGCLSDAIIENASRLDAVMLRPIDDAASLTDVLQDERINALCLGPGLGIERTKALLPAALAPSEYDNRSVVLDADALTVLAESGELRGLLHANCVLTPHGGEFERVFPEISRKLKDSQLKGPGYSKVDAVRAAAKQAGCIVLLKGPATVIAHPAGGCVVHAALYENAAPWLASAGSGDVLAGFITGLIARGSTPFAAAVIATWLHVQCAHSFGPGLIAEDLPEELPKVFRDIGV